MIAAMTQSAGRCAASTIARWARPLPQCRSRTAPISIPDRPLGSATAAKRAPNSRAELGKRRGFAKRGDGFDRNRPAVAPQEIGGARSDRPRGPEQRHAARHRRHSTLADDCFRFMALPSKFLPYDKPRAGAASPAAQQARSRPQPAPRPEIHPGGPSRHHGPESALPASFAPNRRFTLDFEEIAPLRGK